MSHAANGQFAVKTQASYQQALRLGTLSINDFASPRYDARFVTVPSQSIQPSYYAPVVNRVDSETRRFTQANRYHPRTPTIRNNTRTKAPPAPAPVPAAAAVPAKADPAERVIRVGSQQEGKRYRWGGESPLNGFDCSGLVQFSMKKGAGVALPRTAADQYAISTKVPISKAMRGDLVFFNTSKRKRISHVGIYLGNNTFLHAPRAGKRIQRAEINGYWRNRLIGFGRIPGACKIPAFYG
ncbi:C40 family peptidase [Thiofilum flexile]|uniref:C40 family peptidase n=1 Tax=Thiofilum flexile TaxID=125627 RepID=UPI001FE0BD10|nr:C40 family peptidase [Thiofilum flexile]